MAAVFAQGGFIGFIVIGSAAHPAAPNNALPLESQGADRRVVVFAFGALVQIKGGGPAGPQDTLFGAFMEALAFKERAQIATMDVAHFAALFGDRGDAAVALEVGCAVEALPVRAHGGQQARSQDGAGAGQAGEDFTVRVLTEDLSDLLVEGFDGAHDLLELAADELDAQGKALIEGGFIAHGHGALDQFEALFDELLAAGLLEVVEALEGGGLGLLDGLQGGLLEQEGGGQGTPKVLATEFQGLGEVGFEQGLEAVGQSGTLVDGGAAVGDQLLEQAGWGVLGFPGFEFVEVGEEQFGGVLGIGAVVFGAAGDEGFPVFLEGDGIDGVKGDPVISFQEGDEQGGRLFQADADAGLGVLLAQLREPLAKVFRGAGYGLGTGLAGGGGDEVEVHFAIGTVQADDQVVGVLSLEHMMCLTGFIVC